MSKISKGTIWISGLSASGKTTLSKNIYRHLTSELNFSNITLLDGESLRERLSRKYGYNLEERFEVVKNIVRIVQEEQTKNHLVIVATISPSVEMRDYARKSLSGTFVEVYMNCPTNICATRDYKGNYANAFAGNNSNMVGVDLPYEISKQAEITIDSVNNDKESCLTQLKNELCEYFPEISKKKINKEYSYTTI